MRIYADNAATTKMSRTAVEAMLPYLSQIYGNPSSLHSAGQEAAQALFAARQTVAEQLGWIEQAQTHLKTFIRLRGNCRAC